MENGRRLVVATNGAEMSEKAGSLVVVGQHDGSVMRWFKGLMGRPYGSGRQAGRHFHSPLWSWAEL